MRFFILILIALFVSASNGQYTRVLNWPVVPAEFTLKSVTATTVDFLNGEVYVAQRGKQAPPILVFEQHSGKFLRQLGAGLLVTPHGLRLHEWKGQKELWVTDMGAHCVYVLTPLGEPLATIGHCGVNGSSVNPLLFQEPTDLAFASDGSVYIGDSDDSLSNHVIKLSRGANYTFQVSYAIGGIQGSSPGLFSCPHSLATDSLDRLWVADRGNARIQVFQPNSPTYIGQWSCPWSAHNVTASTPFGLYLDQPRGLMTVADGAGSQLIFLEASMSRTSLLDIGQCRIVTSVPVAMSSVPHELSMDNDGAVYVAEVGGGDGAAKYVRQ